MVNPTNIGIRWKIYYVSTALFVLSQFYRAAIAVITPQLVRDLHVGTAELGSISAAFFYAFASAQIPIAIFLDRIGAARLMVGLNLVAVAGALLFATAHSAAALMWARFLLGLGMACNLMGTFKLIALWFAPIQFATLTGLVFSIGTAGNMLAATPLVVMVQAFGFRLTFVFFACLNLILTVLFFLVAGKADRVTAGNRTAPAGQQEGLAFFAAIRRLLAQKDYWIIAAGAFCRYGVYASIQTLYAGPYLMEVMGYSPAAAGNILIVMSIGLILGGPAFGMASDYIAGGTRKGLILPGLAGLGAAVWLLSALPRSANVYAVTAVFFSIGIFSSVGNLLYSHMKDRMPAGMAGAAVTGINFFTMIGPAIFLQAAGMLMPGGADYPAAFETFGFCMLAAAALYYFTADAGRRTVASA